MILLSCAMLLIPVLLFLTFVAWDLGEDLHLLLFIFSALLSVACLFLLFHTGCRDPGIIPRQPPDEEYNSARKERSKRLVINGVPIQVRYNETAHFYQPPRAHHCSVNDNCIERFDHHCPWIGTTVGLRNYRSFLMFIFTTSLLCLWVIALGVTQLALAYDDAEPQQRSVVEAMRSAPFAVGLIGYCVLALVFVGGLSAFHIRLLSTNQTTYENFRSGIGRSGSEARINPFDRGCLANWAEVFCMAIPASRCHFRDYYPP